MAMAGRHTCISKSKKVFQYGTWWVQITLLAYSSRLQSKRIPLMYHELEADLVCLGIPVSSDGAIAVHDRKSEIIRLNMPRSKFESMLV